ncbi:MAG: hypothetical protein ABIE03_07420 [Patescibacteria group bacterium]|nr:hypothetical protein [Patescibacteria group bacterium]
METRQTPVEILSAQLDYNAARLQTNVKEAAVDFHNVTIFPIDRWEFAMYCNYPGGLPTWLPCTIVGSCFANGARRTLVAHYHNPVLGEIDLSDFGDSAASIGKALSQKLSDISSVDDNGIRRNEHRAPYRKQPEP